MKKIYNSKEERLTARRARRKLIQTSQYKERYISKESPSGCWEWIGSKWGSGYGYVRVGGKSTSAHRYIYSVYKGPIPDHLDACHTCDNPSCVNPEHIFLGTVSDNMKDCYAKGRRSQKGESNGNYKHGLYVKDLT